MHHVKQDQRSRESAAAIANALFALVTLKPWQEIGVSEVVSLAQVGRATFYRNFDTLEDVLTYQLQIASKRLLDRIDAARGNGILKLEDYLRIASHYWLAESSLLKILLASEQAHRLSECLIADFSATGIRIEQSKHQTLHIECLCTLMAKVILHLFVQQKNEDPDTSLRFVLQDLQSIL